MGLRPCSVSVVAGPDTGSLAARIRASSAGERPVSEIDGDLPGTRIFTSSIAEADVFVVAGGGGHLESEGDRVITKNGADGAVPRHRCNRQVRPAPAQRGGTRPAPEPQRRELCRDGYEPALRGGNVLLCLFPGTFGVLAEGGWDLTRPPA